jgi:hypothetical protein
VKNKIRVARKYGHRACFQDAIGYDAEDMDPLTDVLNELGGEEEARKQ